MDDLRGLFVKELADIYDAEQQLVKALPKMAKAANFPQLRQAFEKHLQQTKGQVARLEQVFETIGETPQTETCKGMKGLVAEGRGVIKEDAEPATKDAALIAAAQKVEHYEIATYGTLRTYAETLGEQDAAKLLQETLDEESETDQRLTELATTTINPSAT
jgi:ferritin-like metal-binding protein YciE